MTIKWYLVLAAVCLYPAVVVSSPLLQRKSAQKLAEAVPAAEQARHAGGCISSEYSELGAELALIQVRNACPHSGSGLIGNFVVDRRSGRVWSDIDRTEEVRSPELDRVRRRLVKLQ